MTALPIRVETGYVPHKYQREIHAGLKRFSVVIAHRRFGKTVLAVNTLVDAALRCRKPDGRFSYIAPFRSQAKAVAWDYLKKFALTVPGTLLAEADLSVEFPNKARVRLYGSDNPDSMRGLYFDGAVLDEVADMRPETWGEVVRPALSDRLGWCLFIGTPKGPNLLHDLFLHAQKDPTWFAGFYPVDETGLIAESELELARAVMSTNSYRQEFLCDFTASSDNVLIPVDLASDAARRTIDERMLAGLPRIVGVDVARFGCFDDQTEILTDDGWKLFSVLRGDERVLTLNGDVAEWGPIEEIHKYPFVGEMNLYESNPVNFCVTDNHKFLVRSHSRSNRYVLKRYDELPNDFMVRAWNGWSGTSPELMEFTTAVTMPHGGERLHKHSFRMVDWASFMGWFLSEGNVYLERRDSGRYRILLTQYPGVKRDGMEALLMSMGIHWRVTSNGQQLEFTSRSIGQHLLTECGHGAANKRVPKYIKEGSPEIIRAFLDSYLMGDGHCRADGTGRVYHTTSRQLVDDTQEMLAKIGRAGKISAKDLAGSKAMIGDRQITRLTDSYSVYERALTSCRYKNGPNANRDRHLRKSNAVRIPYSGFVWCVSTPHKTIYVRRKGVPMWSGNSDRSVIFRRCGLGAYTPLVFEGMDNMDLVGRVVNVIGEWQPDAVFIDAGRGEGVIDRLRQLGHDVIEVNFGGKPDNPRYSNKRTEMWDKMAQWLRQGGVLPPMPELKADICAPTYSFDPSNRMVLESKDAIKARGLRSTDIGDALALTFSHAVHPNIATRGQSTVKSDYNPYEVA